MAGRLNNLKNNISTSTPTVYGRLNKVTVTPNKTSTSGNIINEMIKSGQATTTPISSLPSRTVKKLPNIDTALNDQLLKKGISQETINKQYATPSGLSNLLSGIKQIETDIQKKTTDYFEPVAGKTRIRDVAREAQTITKNISVPKSEEEAKKMGMVKFGNTYMDPTMAVGSLKNVAKEGLDAIGRQLLKNIKGATPEIIAKGKSLLSPLIQEARKQPMDMLTGKERKLTINSNTFKPRTYSETPKKGVIEYGDFPSNGNDAKTVNAIMEKIKAGERPPVLVGKSTSGKLMVSDGNHTLNAYKKLGIKDIPVIEKKSGILDEVSQPLQEGVNPLIQEARKYKSAEEFVKAQGTPVYRTEKADIAYKGKSVWGDGKYFGIDKNQVKEMTISPHSGKSTGGKVDEYVIPSNLKIKEIDISWEAMKPEDFNKFARGNDLKKQILNEGYDGVILKTDGDLNLGGDQLIMYKNADQIKTKSQLTDIWNKANKTDIANQKGFNPEKYVAEQVAKQEVSRIAEQPNTIGKIGNFFNEVKSKLVDSNAPIEDVLAKSLKQNKITLKPTEHITNQIDRVYRSPVLAGQFARDNGLETIIKNVDNLNNLDQYMIAKQAKDVAINGIKTGRDLIKDQALIDSFSQKYEPIAQQVNNYSQKLLDYSVDSGLISKETSDILKNKYPNYVPINRIFNELEKGEGFGTKAVASLSKQTVVQTLKGSEKQIESPISSLLSKTNDAFLQGEKNKAAKLLTSYKNLPNNPFQLQELKKGESSPYTVSFLDNGIKKTFSTTKDVANAAKALDVQQLNVLGKIFALPVRIAKIGITGINLPFVASNIAKDQITGIINSNNALKTSVANPLNFVKALYNAVGHGKLYEEMVRAGGGGTSFDIARNQVKQTVERIRAKRSVGSAIKYTIKHPSELLRAVENIIGRSEELTRIQQYGGTKQALLKQGMSEADAIAGAARAARENTVNFARRGEWGQVLNSAFLYLNAGIQGTRTFVRNMAQKPIQTSVKLGLTVFTPVATATLWNLSDPERKKAYEDIAEFEKENNIIIVPPNPTKDENGKWNIIKIPLSQEINNIASLARRPIEQSFGLDPVRAGEVAKAFIGSVSPINPSKGSVLSTITPQAIKPTIEAATNRNLFTGYKQVSDTLSKLSPELQVKPTTSGTAIQLGKLLKSSPIKIEEFIKGTMGGVGSQLIHLSDLALNKMDIIPKEQIHGQKVMEAITARFMKATGGNIDEKSNKKLETILTKQADENFIVKQEAELLYDELKSLPKSEAAIKFKDIIEKNPNIAKKVSDIAEEEKLGLDYNDRLIMQLQVKNGERAKFIYETLMTLPTKEEKAQYYSNLINKKIISEEVSNQIVYLLNKKNE